MPYLATFLNCGLWVLYGLPMVHTNSILVVTINGTGFVIEVIYLWLFLIYFDRKKRRWPVLILAAECLFMAVLALLVLTLAHLTKLHSAIVGNICMVGNIMMYASPSAVMVSLLHLFFLENRWPYRLWVRSRSSPQVTLANPIFLDIIVSLSWHKEDFASAGFWNPNKMEYFLSKKRASNRLESPFF